MTGGPHRGPVKVALAGSTGHVAVAAAVVSVASAVLLFGDWGSPSTVRVTQDVVLAASALAATLSCWSAARSTRGRLRVGWSALATGLLAWTVAEMLWTYQVIAAGAPAFPSPADAFYMMFPVCAVVALLMFWNRRGGRLTGRVLLDGLIVAGSLFVVAWLLPMSRLYEAGSAGRREFTVALAYPVLDIVLLTVAATVLINAPARQRFPLTLLTLALLITSAADSGYAYLQLSRSYRGGSLVDLGWLVGLLLITVAATAGRTVVDDEPALDEMPGWISVWLPYLPLMVAGGVLAVSPVTASASRIVLGTGVVLTAAVLLRQLLVVDSNRRLMSAVADQALRDPLTGLANRTLFSDRLGRALKQDAAPVGVIMIDLDDFKLINDTLGHGAGDQLLIGTAERITTNVRAEDTVARLGGDEFAVLIQAPAELLESLARRLVEAFTTPLVLDGHALVMKPSIGLAVAEPGESHLSAEELLERADLAMYAAKRNRNHSLRVFTADLRQQGQAERETVSRGRNSATGGAEALHAVRELRQALDVGDLLMRYQPTFDLSTGAAVWLEARLRWRHPDRGLLTPDDFLPLARRHGLTDAITGYVLDRALDDARTWRSGGIDLPVAAKLFATSLSMPGLPDQIDRALAARELGPSALMVEFADDTDGSDLGATRRLLLALHERGIRVAVDDFGSGHAPLRLLRDLPVDVVKLDRDLITPIAVDPRGAAVVLTVIDLARILGIATVAEGVEDGATLDVLRRFDCDMGQGGHFCAPLSVPEVLDSAVVVGQPRPSGPFVHLSER